MVRFINDLRHGSGVPELPFVIAETRMTGTTETYPRTLSHASASRCWTKKGVQRERCVIGYEGLLATEGAVTERSRI